MQCWRWRNSRLRAFSSRLFMSSISGFGCHSQRGSPDRCVLLAMVVAVVPIYDDKVAETLRDFKGAEARYMFTRTPVLPLAVHLDKVDIEAGFKCSHHLLCANFKPRQVGTSGARGAMSVKNLDRGNQPSGRNHDAHVSTNARRRRTLFTRDGVGQRRQSQIKARPTFTARALVAKSKATLPADAEDSPPPHPPPLYPSERCAKCGFRSSPHLNTMSRPQSKHVALGLGQVLSKAATSSDDSVWCGHERSRAPSFAPASARFVNTAASSTLGEMPDARADSSCEAAAFDEKFVLEKVCSSVSCRRRTKSFLILFSLTRLSAPLHSWFEPWQYSTCSSRRACTRARAHTAHKPHMLSLQGVVRTLRPEIVTLSMGRTFFGVG